MSRTSRLFCWELNTSMNRIFSVNVGDAEIWDDVKKAIKEEKKPEFDDIAANALKLWKVTIGLSQLSRLESEDFLKEVTATNPLDPLGPLSTDLNHPLHDDQRNIIIAQRPRRLFPSGITQNKTRKVTPSSETLELDALRPEIQKTLDLIRPEIELFLQNPELPEWVPPSDTIPTVSEYLRNLWIPAYQNGSPSLLFHNLSSQAANEVFDQTENTFVCNTSGSGKTRFILEGLIKYWGLYFVVARDGNNVGVDDLENALKDIGSYEDDLRFFEGPAQQERVESNIHISNRAVKKVLAARLVVFELFLQLVVARDHSILPKHRRIWLVFQLFSPLPGFGTPHPFNTMKECLNRASDRALTFLIHDFGLVRQRYFPTTSKLFITLDQAQVASRLNRFSFLSSSNRTKSRSILREIVKVFSSSALAFQIVVSGTGLSLEDVEDDLTSSVAKPLRRFDTFVDFGMLDDPVKLGTTLRKYIPPFMLESHSGRSLQLRIQEYLPGRYQFLVSFLELLLKNGMESPHTLLNEYLAQYFLCPPGDVLYTTPFTSQEPPLRTTPRIRTFDWERLRQNLSDVRQVVAIIQSHLTKGSIPTFGPLPHKHVEYGIARLRHDHQAEIIEPLAFLSVVRWLETQKDLCLEENLIHKLADQNSRGYAFEEVVIPFLLRTFCRPTALNLVFQFHGTVPEWASQETHIIGRLEGKEVPINVLEIPRYPSLGMVYYAETIEEIVHWLTGSPAPSVLLASHLFGPDVIIRCQGVLLMGQDKSFLTGNKNGLDAKTTARAINSLNSDKWFVKETPQRRQMLIDTFQKFTILRFVTGYPLPANLDLEAQSVNNALSDLGTVPLATIPLDAFRGMFVLPGEVNNVLQPMEQALKRKRGMMD